MHLQVEHLDECGAVGSAGISIFAHFFEYEMTPRRVRFCHSNRMRIMKWEQIATIGHLIFHYYFD